jgi:DNA-binding Lrp family transcriptional regulator
MKYESSKKAEGTFKLDLKDKKILRALAQNARESKNTIAKKAGLSKDAILYRINKYYDLGLIQGCRAVIDANKLGYLNFHVLLQIAYLSDEEEKKIVNKIISHNNVRALLKFSGRFKFEIALIAKNLNEFQETLREIISDCKGNIVNYEILQIPNYYVSKVFPDSFLKSEEIYIEENDSKIKTKKEKLINDELKYDEIDKKIIFSLAENADVKYYELAEKTKLSADAVAYRIKNLLDSKLIKGFVPIVNYSSISYSIFSILVKFGPDIEKRKSELKEFLHRNKHVLWAVECVGKYNMMAYICVKSIEEYHIALNEFNSVFGENILELDTLIAYEEFKLNYFPKNIVN